MPDVEVLDMEGATLSCMLDAWRGKNEVSKFLAIIP